MREPTPRVSVVMSVYNDVARLQRAVDSVLNQSFDDLELIVVNDGSSDGSGQLLEQLAEKDARLRVLHQENGGLTRALIRGCALARGEFIARQDSDDWSHPRRIAEQVALLESDERIGFVSCGAQYVGPNDEPLTVMVRTGSPRECNVDLLQNRQGPPAHGSVMFRSDLYSRVGGYREEFHFSQDSDLWLRMAENAWIGYVEAVRYVHRKDISSTSGAQRPVQRKFAEIGHRCRHARMSGEDEAVPLAEAMLLTAQIRSRRSGQTAVDYHALDSAAYLLGSQLAVNRDVRARQYLWPIVRRQPLHWRAWVRMLQSFMTGRVLSK